MAFDPLWDAYRNKAFFRGIFGGFSGAVPLFWIAGVIVGESSVKAWPIALGTPVAGFMAGWLLDVLWDKAGGYVTVERWENE